MTSLRMRDIAAGLTAVVLLGSCVASGPVAVTGGQADCRRPDLGEGPMPWLDNDLAQMQLQAVAGLIRTVDGIVDQTLDASNQRAVVLFDPRRITQAEAELAVLGALRQAIAERAEWQRAHAQWLEEVRRGGGDLSPDERRTLLQPAGPPEVTAADRQLSVEVRPACGDPQALREVHDDLSRRAWLEDAGLDAVPGGMGWVINYSLGVVEVRLTKGPDTQRIAEALRERYGDLIEVVIREGGFVPAM